MDLMKMLRKVKTEDVSTIDAQRKEEELLILSSPETPNPQGTDPAIIEKISNLENKTPKIELSISSLKRENDEIKNKLSQMDSKLIDMLSLYEIVTNQVNPFVESAKVANFNTEKLENMEKQIGSMDEKIDTLSNDILVYNRVDVKGIVKKVFLEED